MVCTSVLACGRPSPSLLIMLGNLRPMSQSTPSARPHSIKALQVAAQTSGSVVGARWTSGSWINSHPPGLTAAAICSSTAGAYSEIAQLIQIDATSGIDYASCSAYRTAGAGCSGADKERGPLRLGWSPAGESKA
jgi:hypothetical protein